MRSIGRNSLKGTPAAFCSLLFRMNLSSILRMFSPRKRRMYAVVALLCQVGNLVFWHPTHFDFDIFSASAHTRLTQHEDADHCTHLPIGDHSQCAICISSQQRISVEPTNIGLLQLQILGSLAAEQVISSFLSLHSDSFYRRGPPALLG